MVYGGGRLFSAITIFGVNERQSKESLRNVTISLISDTNTVWLASDRYLVLSHVSEAASNNAQIRTKLSKVFQQNTKFQIKSLLRVFRGLNAIRKPRLG